MKIEKNIPLLEEILIEWKSKIGNDYEGYKNHVYRMLNYCFYLSEPSKDDRKKLIIAAAFHDLGIWSDNTVDYLPPSVSLAKDYLEQNGLNSWVEEVSLVIDLHHKITQVKNKKHPSIELFRKADLVDFSLGSIRSGVSKSYIQEVKSTFPNAGFHKRLVQLSWQQFKQHPFNPAPMMKW